MAIPVSGLFIWTIQCLETPEANNGVEDAAAAAATAILVNFELEDVKEKLLVGYLMITGSGFDSVVMDW